MTEQQRLFLTGAAGFVGSTVLDHVLRETDWHVVTPVTYRHQGSGARIDAVLSSLPTERWRVDVVPFDLALPIDAAMARRFGRVDYVWNIASESHVDRSLRRPVPFVRNNVDLMLNMLEYAVHERPRVFLHMSTDEVFGPAADGYQHREWDPIRPSNPYAASKAAQEALAYSYWRAMGVPLIMTNTMNLIAPAPQSAEKFVPKIARALFHRKTLTVHASPEGVSGSRCWVDARDFAAAWLWLTQRFDGDGALTYYPAMSPEPLRFNIVGEEASNLDVAQRMARLADLPLKYELVDYHTQRPGHDHRYALDGSKLRDLGWTGGRSLDESLRDIVKWYAENPSWLEV